MKIEHMGIRITDVPGFEYIEVQPGGTFALKSEFSALDGDGPVSYDLTAFTQLRNALDAALEQHAKFDTAMTTPNIEQPPYAVGQALTGAEDLPVGTVVRDSGIRGAEIDDWRMMENGLFETIRDGKPMSPNGDTTFQFLIEKYAPITIVSLP